MNTWTEGYVTDHSYEHYYFPQLSPRFLEYLLLLSGRAFTPGNDGKPMRYLELGYGQGLSLNIHAAVSQEAECWGTDFMPEHAKNARELSHHADLGTQALNVSFAQLDEQSRAGKLPGFDMIVMHGIWSWISEENQKHILNIIERSLNPGGMVYVSYNAMPGLATAMPLRELIAIHAERKGAGKNTATRAAEAVNMLKALSDAGAAFFSGIPASQTTINGIVNADSAYLAHEYLNRNWHANYFADVAKSMTGSGCCFATSANPVDALLISQPDNTVAFLDAISDPVKKEVLRDFNLNKSFRSDIFIKGERFLSSEAFRERLDHSFLAIKNPLGAFDTLSVNIGRYKNTLDKNVYYPLLEVLAENDYAPKSVAFLRTHPCCKDYPFETFLFHLIVLLGGHFISPAQPAPSKKTTSACQRLNRILCEKTAQGDVQQYLASPVLGCGLSFQAYMQLFLLSFSNGKKDPADWAESARKILAARGQSLKVETPQGTKEGGDAFLHQAHLFEKTILPYLKAMGILLSPPETK